MVLVERVQDFRLARKQFLDSYMPPKGEDICLSGILARPAHEFAATYEAFFFGKGSYVRPREEVGNVTYLH